MPNAYFRDSLRAVSFCLSINSLLQSYTNDSFNWEAAYMKPQEYQQLVRENQPPRRTWRNVILAFVVGGSFSLIGQIVLDFVSGVERTTDEASAITLAIMILIGAVLTGLGIYDEIAEIGGAGAAVPITGFSNTVTAAAMEFRREGFILGMGAKMFVIAGPVLVYGILSGFLVALIKSVVLGYF